MKKRTIVVAAALMLAAGASSFAATFSLTLNAEKDFSQMPTAGEAIESFSTDPAPLWGFGWEVVMKRLGLGGTYYVKFFEDTGSSWTLDWNGQPLYVSYHFFGPKPFLDPFVMAGAGCSGRVLLQDSYPGTSALFLSLYPFVGAGFGIHLGDFTVGASLSYVPFISGIPATDIPAYPAGNYQLSVYSGVTLGHK